MTIAVDLVVKGVTEPVRFIVETKAKIFPSGEKFFWTPSKPKFREIYILELKEVRNLCIMTPLLNKQSKWNSLFIFRNMLSLIR